MRNRILLLVLFLFLSFTEIDNYSLYGRLVDHGFNPISEFRIKIIKEKTNDLVKEIGFNNQNGEFLIKDLPPNKYIFEITVENYTKFSIRKEIFNKNESVGELFLQNTW